MLAADALHPPRARARASWRCLDPPYGKDVAVPALTALAAAGWLAPGALVALELPAQQTFAPPAGFTLLDERRYGAARIVFLRYGGA